MGVLYYIEHTEYVKTLLEHLKHPEIKTLIMDFETVALIIIGIGLSIDHISRAIGLFNNPGEDEERRYVPWSEILLGFFVLGASIAMIGYSQFSNPAQ